MEVELPPDGATPPPRPPKPEAVTPPPPPALEDEETVSRGEQCAAGQASLEPGYVCTRGHMDKWAHQAFLYK